MNADSLALAATDLTTGYARIRRRAVVTRASFHIAAGNIVALIGPNGSGKTTLLNTLVGLIPPLGGSLLLAGLPPVHYRMKSGIGYLPEGLRLPGTLTGRGLLALLLLSAGRAAASALPDALQLAHIDFDLEQPIRHLSKGMQQRLALALTLLPMPRLLLLDEPEAGLDPGQRILLRRSIRQFADQGRIVIVASHDVSGLCSSADVTYLLNDQTMTLLDAAVLADTDRVLRLFERK